MDDIFTMDVIKKDIETRVFQEEHTCCMSLIHLCLVDLLSPFTPLSLTVVLLQHEHI